MGERRLQSRLRALPREDLLRTPVKFDIRCAVFFHRFSNFRIDLIFGALGVWIHVEKTLTAQMAAELRIEEIHAFVELF